MSSLLAITTTLASGDASASSNWFGENGFLENAQLLFLLVTLTRYLSLWATSSAVLRSMFALLALIALGCILRELDFDSNGPLGTLDWVLKGPVRITVIVIAIPVVAVSVKNLLQRPTAAPRVLFGTWWGRLSILGGMTLVFGALFDRGIIPAESPQSWEESAETLGFLLIAISSFIPEATAKDAIDQPLLNSTPGPGIPPDGP